jgi:hypothetical protein
MWLLPSLGRPRQAQAVIDACHATGMTQPAVLYVDGNPGAYQALSLPDNWRMVCAGSQVGIGQAMNWCYKTYPNERCYGWLADDTYPETAGWCERIEAETGEHSVVNVYDRYLCDNPHELRNVERGALFTSATGFGGGLVRALGWWAMPRLKQVGIDWIWTELVRDIGIAKYLPDVIVRHDNFETGRRHFDATDHQSRKVDYDADVQLARSYLKSKIFEADRKALLRLHEKHNRIR